MPTESPPPSPSPWRERQTLAAHAKPISSIELSPDGRLLASSCASRRRLGAVTLRVPPILTLASLSCRLAADSSVKIWRFAADSALEATPASSLYGHEAGVSAVCWSPDARHVVSASDDQTARLWDVETAKTLATLGATRSSLDAALSLPLSLLDGSSKAWGLDGSATNGSSLAPETPAESHSNFVSCAAFNLQGSLVATGSHDESVRLWDVRSGKSVAQVAAHQEPVVSVGFHPTDGSLLVTASYDGLVRVWDVASRQCLRTIITEPAAPVGSARFSPNGRYVLSATLDGTLRLWDYMREICVRSYSGHTNVKFGLQCAFLEQQESPQALVACGSEDSRILLWDVGSQEVCGVLEGHEHPTLALASHPTRPLLVSGSNRELKTWTPDTDSGS
ncbi:hypothetical protein BBJ28_00004224 [Nothophytophthora sp. Chile5]|nr:hypothetical protein BBJ28_00004224 [Nothophytophthora sp. Chile5]